MRAAQDLDVLSAAAPDRPPIRGLARPLLIAAAIAAVVIAVDQLTKRWALNRLSTGPCDEVAGNCIDLFWTARFHLIFNRGAAFSTGGDLGPLFGVIAFGMAIFLLNLARKRTDRLGPMLLGLIAGGAVGNLIDRIARSDGGFLDGAVIDFVDFQWWPVFNVADAAVVVGVVVFVVYSFFAPEAAADEKSPDGD